MELISRWQTLLNLYGGSGGFLFNHFTIADAMSAHLVNRFVTYNVRLPNDIINYCENMRSFSPMVEWIRGAESEDWTLPATDDRSVHTENADLEALLKIHTNDQKNH